MWAGHAAEILRAAYKEADDAQAELRCRQTEAKRIEDKGGRVQVAHEEAKRRVEGLAETQHATQGRIKGLEATDAYRTAGALTALEEQLRAEQDTAETTLGALASAARAARKASTDLESSLTELPPTSAHIRSGPAKPTRMWPDLSRWYMDTRPACGAHCRRVQR